MKKHKVKRAWWQKPKNIRRLAMGTLSSLVVVAGVLYFLLGGGGGGGGQRAVLRPFTPAEAFSLPKTSGGDFRSSEYFGKGNVLLYFNEGMG
jgi:hypothetical protein